MPLVYQKTGGTHCAVMSVQNQQYPAPFTLKSSGNAPMKVVPFGVK